MKTIDAILYQILNHYLNNKYYKKGMRSVMKEVGLEEDIEYIDDIAEKIELRNYAIIQGISRGRYVVIRITFEGRNFVRNYESKKQSEASKKNSSTKNLEGGKQSDLRELITRNRLHEAIKLIGDNASDSLHKEQLILVESQLNSVSDNEIRGTIDDETKTLHLNKIKNSILKIHDEIQKYEKTQETNIVAFASVVVDSENCAWRVSHENQEAFYLDAKKRLYPFLILNWSFTNNTDNNVVLTRIRHNSVSLPVGISGARFAMPLEPLKTYKVAILPDSGEQREDLITPISVFPKGACMVQTEILAPIDSGNSYPIVDRIYIDFKFEFSNGQIVQSPRIFLNCESDESTGWIGKSS